MMGGWNLITLMFVLEMVWVVAAAHDYGDALTKSILFFEGQRSGKLPPSQRLTWRQDSALSDGFHVGVDLVGGYYDAGDNVKFNFPMAFSTTMLAWSVLDFGKSMDADRIHAVDAIRWATDYLLKATSVPGFVFAQVGDAFADHSCWQRPEDMDTPRTAYAVSKNFPGSEVSAEIAAALASASLVFRPSDREYAARLLKRARTVFDFANQYRGSYNQSLGPSVCDFYCDYSGYEDELLWGAAWLYRATKAPLYWDFIVHNIKNLEIHPIVTNIDGTPFVGGSFAEFGWDAKHAGIYVLVSKLIMNNPQYQEPFVSTANKFVCSVLPESPSALFQYSPGGLLFKPGGSNMQHVTALSFLLLVHARTSNQANNLIKCGNVAVPKSRLVKIARQQVDYILGTNPLNLSYMVGYGAKYPQRIHHRGASLPSVNQHRGHIGCQAGAAYSSGSNPNPNLLTGAVVGGPDIKDSYSDSRPDFVHSEPATYINAPLVGLLAYFKSNQL